MERDIVTYHFFLPYIVQPKGAFDFRYKEKKYRIEIKHQLSTRYLQIVSGIRFNPNNPIKIEGPKDIYTGISEIKISLPMSSKTERMDDTRLRNKIADLLNKYQYYYLYVSGKYWWNAVSPDHFVNMKMITDSREGFSSNWGGSHRKLPLFKSDDEVIPNFSTFVMEDRDLPIQFVFLIDAKRDYLNGEYHLMYVELTIALEHLTKKAYKKISSIYEKKMFKEGKLEGQLSHILSNYCEWKTEDIEIIVEICNRRNEVVHNSKRVFLPEEAYSHLVVGEKAINKITEWIDNPN